MATDIEIKMLVNSIAIKNLAKSGSDYEYYHKQNIKSIIGVKLIGAGARDVDTNQRKFPVPYVDLLQVVINFHDENEHPPIKMHIQEINKTLHPGWTDNAAGLTAAIDDINKWI